MSLGEKLCNARLARKETASEVAKATRMKVQTVEDLERENFSRIPAAIYAKGFIKLYAEHVGMDPKPLIEEYVARFTQQDAPTPARAVSANMGKILGGEKNAPSVTAEEDEQSADTPDLFDAVPSAKSGRRTAYAAVPRATEPAHRFAARMAASRFRELAAWSGRMCQALRDRLVTVRGAVDARRGSSAPRARKAPMPFLSMPSAAVLAAAGALIVAAIVVATVSRCSRTPATTDPAPSLAPQTAAPQTAAPPVAQELRLAIELDEPYFD